VPTIIDKAFYSSFLVFFKTNAPSAQKADFLSRPIAIFVYMLKNPRDLELSWEACGGIQFTDHAATGIEMEL